MNVTPWSSTVGRAAKVVSPAPRDLWRAALSADPGALLSHTPEWIDMICAVDGWMDGREPPLRGAIGAPRRPADGREAYM